MTRPSSRCVPVFVLLALAACTKDAATPGAPSCDAYLDCLASTDQEAFEAELGVYGDQGSCFANTDASDCNTACAEKLGERIEDQGADCEPAPPDTGTDSATSTASTTGSQPEPDADGHVDCAEIVGGPTVGPGEPGPLGFPEAACNPRASGEGEFRCCADDPAAEGGALPDYMGKNIAEGATPYFSGLNNDLGTSGLCVRTTDIPAGSGLLEPAAVNCPVPCNPTWADDQVAAVCGASRVCCQTRALQPEDCVLDGDTWRPVAGTDIGSSTVTPPTTWAPGEHATHQDPGGSGCLTFAGGQANDAFEACVATLTVADQRGFCIAFGPGQACPDADPSYLDACEQINMGLVPPPA